MLQKRKTESVKDATNDACGCHRFKMNALTIMKILLKGKYLYFFLVKEEE